MSVKLSLQPRRSIAALRVMRGSALFLCLFLAGCAVYDAAPPQGSGGTLDGGSPGTSQGAAAGTEADSGGRGGTAPSATGGAGTAGVMHLGGTGTGGSGVAGSTDGGAADAGGEGGAAGQVLGGSSGHAGVGGSTNGGAGGGGSAIGGSGGTPMITDLSSKKPATASSEQTGKESASGNDGDSATRWCAKVGTLPQWWRVDLGATHSLKEFKVSFEYADRKYSYDVETSADDAAYTLQVRTSGTAALQSGLFPAGVSARYVRITVTSTDSSVSPTWASFFEFVVTGT